VTVRRWCCHWMDHCGPAVVAGGLLGMAGFVGAFLAVAAGWLGTTGYLISVALSLSTYGLALVVGHFGDPFVLRRLLEEAQGESHERQFEQVPSSSWTWPVRWNPNLSATSR
jgi:hypothetical protein